MFEEQLARELPGQDVSVYARGRERFLHGTAKDIISAERAASIAATLGKVINLLHVVTPVEEPQILLKVQFADVDRSISSNLGFNLFSTGATGSVGGTSTQQFAPPSVTFRDAWIAGHRHSGQRAEPFRIPART